MKLDFTKLWKLIRLNKNQIALFFCSLYLPMFFHLGYITSTKEYYFLIYDFIIGLGFWMFYYSILGVKLGVKKYRQELPKPKNERYTFFKSIK